MDISLLRRIGSGAGHGPHVEQKLDALGSEQPKVLLEGPRRVPNCVCDPLRSLRDGRGHLFDSSRLVLRSGPLTPISLVGLWQPADQILPPEGARVGNQLAS